MPGSSGLRELLLGDDEHDGAPPHVRVVLAGGRAVITRTTPFCVNRRLSSAARVPVAVPSEFPAAAGRSGSGG